EQLKKQRLLFLGEEPKDNAKDSKEVQLVKEKVLCCQREYDLRYGQYRVGRGTISVLIECSRRLRDAQVDLASTPAERLVALNGFLARSKWACELNRKRWEAGTLLEQDYQQTKFEVKDAELRILRAEKK